ncbi:MAG: rhodanese-like domain-containing protein, partial [Acidobacteriota bacterium]
DRSGSDALCFARLRHVGGEEYSVRDRHSSAGRVTSRIGRAGCGSGDAAYYRAESITLLKEGKAVIIDVRGSEAYKANHTKGSIDFPLSKLEAGDFTGLPRDKKIIAYCT